MCASGSGLGCDALEGIVAIAAGPTSVSTGGTHTCAVADDGAVYCWGLNSDGQLGDGTSCSRVLNPRAVCGSRASAGAARLSARRRISRARPSRFRLRGEITELRQQEKSTVLAGLHGQPYFVLMNELGGLGRLLLAVGLLFVVVGALVLLAQAFPGLRLGRLPGDIRIVRDGFKLYFPFTTMVLLSVFVSALVWLGRWLFK